MEKKSILQPVTSELRPGFCEGGGRCARSSPKTGFFGTLYCFCPSFTLSQCTFQTDRAPRRPSNSLLLQGIADVGCTKVHDSLRFQGGVEPQKGPLTTLGAAARGRPNCYCDSIVKERCRFRGSLDAGSNGTGPSAPSDKSFPVSRPPVKVTTRSDKERRQGEATTRSDKKHKGHRGTRIANRGSDMLFDKEKRAPGFRARANVPGPIPNFFLKSSGGMLLLLYNIDNGND